VAEPPTCLLNKKKLKGRRPGRRYTAAKIPFYIPRIGPHIFLQQNRQTDPGNIYKISLRYMNVGTGRQNIVILLWK
jgi:hypothetical protein